MEFLKIGARYIKHGVKVMRKTKRWRKEDLESGVSVRFYNPQRIRGVALLKFKLLTESSCILR